MSTPRVAYRGKLRRQADGTFAGEMRCVISGWLMTIIATVREDAAGKFFALETVLGETPEALRLPGEDAMRRSA